MIAIVTIGAYSDTSVDFVEHPDREELLSTLRALERECDLDIIGVAERVELFGGTEPRFPITLADVAQPALVRSTGWPAVAHAMREDVLTALPLPVRREALRKRLVQARDQLTWAERLKRSSDINSARALCDLLDYYIAREDAEPKDACWGIAT